MAIDVRVAATVLAPPSGARVARDIAYRSDGARSLRLDVYRPPEATRPLPVVFLVSGDGPEDVITHAKDWGVFRSYGEHLAASGLVGVTFDHGSSERGARTAEVAADVRAAIDSVRDRAENLGVASDRVGLWVFSAGGPFGLAPFLMRRPKWLSCAAGFYTIWDLGVFDRKGSLDDDAVNEWSCVSALEGETLDLPPLLLVRAGLDAPKILEGTDAFVRRAREREVDLTVLDHPTGHHGFDIRDDDERSREIIRETLTFFVDHLRPDA